MTSGNLPTSITVDERHHPDLAEAVRRLVKEFQPDRIYLFGSRARGEGNEDSDYDIMVVVADSELSYSERICLWFSLLSDLCIEAQVIVMTNYEFDRDVPVIASLPARVFREGQTLYAA